MDCQAEKMERYIPNYIGQFGKIQLKGADVLVQALKHYAVAAPLPDQRAYQRLIAKSASELGVTPEAARRAVKRYVEDGWKRGASWKWEKYTGWSADTPPDVNTAVPLLCEAFFDFVQTCGPLIQKRPEPLNHSLPIEDEMMISSHFYMTFADKRELDTYVSILSYRVQRDLYEICTETSQPGEVSWQQFVWMIRQQKWVRDAAAIVIREALKEIRTEGVFHFHAKDVTLLYDRDRDDSSGGSIYSSQLFSGEEGRALVESVLFNVEAVQYKRQLVKGKAYSWESFLAELAQASGLWSETLMAFRDVLARLNFKPIWQSERLEELVKRANRTPDSASP